MTDGRFRRPEQMSSRKDRVPLSTRVTTDTQEALADAAKKAKLSVAEFVANVLDDYVKWLKDKGR